MHDVPEPTDIVAESSKVFMTSSIVFDTGSNINLSNNLKNMSNVRRSTKYIDGVGGKTTAELSGTNRKGDPIHYLPSLPIQIQCASDIAAQGCCLLFADQGYAIKLDSNQIESFKKVIEKCNITDRMIVQDKIYYVIEDDGENSTVEDNVAECCYSLADGNAEDMYIACTVHARNYFNSQLHASSVSDRILAMMLSGMSFKTLYNAVKNKAIQGIHPDITVQKLLEFGKTMGTTPDIISIANSRRIIKAHNGLMNQMQRPSMNGEWVEIDIFNCEYNERINNPMIKKNVLLYIEQVRKLRTHGGASHFALCVCKKSGYIFSMLLKDTKSAIDIVIKFVTDIADHGYTVKTIGMDTGICSHPVYQIGFSAVQDFCRTSGINIHLAEPHHHSSGTPTVENAGRLVKSIMRLGLTYGLSNPNVNVTKFSEIDVKRFWGEAMIWSVYCVNLQPSKGSNITKYESFRMKKPNIQEMRLLPMFAVVMIDRRSKDLDIARNTLVKTYGLYVGPCMYTRGASRIAVHNAARPPSIIITSKIDSVSDGGMNLVESVKAVDRILPSMLNESVVEVVDDKEFEEFEVGVEEFKDKEKNQVVENVHNQSIVDRDQSADDENRNPGIVDRDQKATDVNQNIEKHDQDQNAVSNVNRNMIINDQNQRAGDVNRNPGIVDRNPSIDVYHNNHIVDQSPSIDVYHEIMHNGDNRDIDTNHVRNDIQNHPECDKNQSQLDPRALGNRELTAEVNSVSDLLKAQVIKPSSNVSEEKNSGNPRYSLRERKPKLKSFMCLCLSKEEMEMENDCMFYDSDEEDSMNMMSYAAITGPGSFNKAMNDPKWKDAAMKELNTLIQSGCIIPVNSEEVESVTSRGEGDIVPCFPIYEEKIRDGVLVQKVRIVADGSTTEESEESYASTPSKEEFLLLVHLAAKYGWDIVHLDEKRAFLTAPSSSIRPIYCIIRGTSQYYRVHGALYGLRSAPSDYEKKRVTNFVQKFQFARCISSRNIYRKCEEHGGGFVFMYTFVDDFILFGNKREYTEKIVKEITSILETTEPVWNPSKLLGMDMCRVENKVFLSMESCIKKYELEYKDVMNMFKGREKLSRVPINMSDVIVDDSVLDNLEGNMNMLLTKSERKLYMEIVGSCNWVVQIRFDLSFATSYLSWFLVKPRQHHLKVAIDLLKYVILTSNMSLCVGGNDELRLEAYTDASLATSVNKRSVIGELYRLGTNSGAISFKTSCTQGVSTSSFEAELEGMYRGFKSIRRIQNILDDMGIETEQKPILFCDNYTAVNFVKSLNNPKNSRHMELRLFYIRELYENQRIEVKFITGNDMIADTGTKAKDFDTIFRSNRIIMGLHHSDDLELKY